jgi:excisionase family DNA binding protein
MNSDLDLLTLKEAATLLKVSVVTLRRWIKQGRLPAYHVGPGRSGSTAVISAKPSPQLIGRR